MYFLSICTNTSLALIWTPARCVVNAVMIGIPILLIIFGMIDLGKAVIASKEDEIKKSNEGFWRVCWCKI